MTLIEHLNAGFLHAPPHPRLGCHCLLLRDPGALVLVDTGIGLLDVRDPVGRVGQDAITNGGFLFAERDTARRQLERRGVDPDAVAHLVLTHLDPDHAGGIADFPDAAVHVAGAEREAALHGGHPRYRPVQFAHGPRWVTHDRFADRWFGLPACALDLGLQRLRVRLVALPGHAAGHCGVAIAGVDDDRWLLHAGDAYYLRGQLDDPDHPVTHMASAVAADPAAYARSLDAVRRLARDHADVVQVIGYHDLSERPAAAGGTGA
jgi:glyoxylase-like metal-dependent hydrolase (beta-lactamase superfamily II)